MKQIGSYCKAFCLIFSLLLLLFSLAVFFLNARMRPIVLASGRAQVLQLGTQAIHDAILQAFSQTQYEALVYVQKDEQGKISMMQTNAAAINQIMARVSLDAQNRIQSVGERGIGVRLGTLIGGQLFSGKGMEFRVLFKPVGAIKAEYRSNFRSAGINQTIHTISIEVTGRVQLITGDLAHEEEIFVQTPVLENIIVGDVPQAYTSEPGWNFAVQR